MTSGFNADIGDIRQRLEEREDPQARGVSRIGLVKLPADGQQLCVLHYLGPEGHGDVRASITTIIGLSTCARCTSDVATQIDQNGLSAREILAMAQDGTWFE